MKFAIEIDEDALRELAAIKAFHRKQIVDGIEKQLSQQADVPSRNRKLLIPNPDEPELETPTWELRVGEFRVIYEVDHDKRSVHVRAVRFKPPEKRTKDILK